MILTSTTNKMSTTTLNKNNWNKVYDNPEFEIYAHKIRKYLTIHIDKKKPYRLF